MMKRIVFYFGLTVMMACKSSVDETKTTDEIALLNGVSRDTTAIDSSVNREEMNTDFANYYVVIVDTNLDYHFLQKKMYALNQKLHLDIDTMNRYYNETKKGIVLQEDDDDEMYRGEYFPRRYASDKLSLDYLHFYWSSSREKNIALVAGIFEDERSADSLLQLIKREEKSSFKLYANIYVGCMH